jgi:hypothetical protein
MQQQSAQSAYDQGKRFLLCDACGAPVEIAPNAAGASCGYCRSPLEVRMRSEAAAASSRARSEPERLEVLAEQDRRFLPPSEIASLFVGERVAPSREAEARTQWQGLRGSLRAQTNEAIAQRFFMLTVALAELCFDKGELLGQRALIESALSVIDSPHHAQVLRAQLARSALNAGEPHSAEAWLALCNPRSENLLADTAYRYARAYLDTTRRDFSAVILTLGSGGVPLSDAYAPECAVLCANAWEQQLQQATAVDVLVSAKRELGPIARRRIRKFIDAHPALSLCPRSEPESERRAAQLDPTPAEGSTVASVLLLVMGGYSLLWGASAIALPAMSYVLDVDFADPAFAISLFAGGLLGVLLFPIGLLGYIRSRGQRARRRGGIVCPVHILGRTRVGPSDSRESIVVRLELLVLPENAPAYTISLDSGIVETMWDNFAPGKILLGRFRPASAEPYALEVS